MKSVLTAFLDELLGRKVQRVELLMEGRISDVNGARAFLRHHEGPEVVYLT